MLYHVNRKPLTLKDGIQLLDLLQTIGFYKLLDGKVDYPCTTEMIDAIASAMKCMIKDIKGTNDNSERVLVDIAIALTPFLDFQNFFVFFPNVQECVIFFNHHDALRRT